MKQQNEQVILGFPSDSFQSWTYLAFLKKKKKIEFSRIWRTLLLFWLAGQEADKRVSWYNTQAPSERQTEFFILWQWKHVFYTFFLIVNSWGWICEDQKKRKRRKNYNEWMLTVWIKGSMLYNQSFGKTRLGRPWGFGTEFKNTLRSHCTSKDWENWNGNKALSKKQGNKLIHLLLPETVQWKWMLTRNVLGNGHSWVCFQFNECPKNPWMWWNSPLTSVSF